MNTSETSSPGPGPEHPEPVRRGHAMSDTVNCTARWSVCTLAALAVAWGVVDRSPSWIAAAMIGVAGLATVELRQARSRREREVGQLRDTLARTDAVLDLHRVARDADTREDLAARSLAVLARSGIRGADGRAGFFVTDAEGEALELVASHDLPAPIESQCARVKFGKCLCGRAAQFRAVQFAGDVDERHETRHEGMDAHGHYSVPIVRAGETRGVIMLYLSAGTRENPRDVAFLRGAANILGIALERMQKTAALAAESTALQGAVNRERAAAETLASWQVGVDKINEARSAFLGSLDDLVRAPMLDILADAEQLVSDDASQRDEHAARIRESGERLLRSIDTIVQLEAHESAPT